MTLRALLPLLIAASVATSAQAALPQTFDELRSQAESGDVAPQRAIAHAYQYGHYRGKPVKVDMDKARGWLKAAVKRGDAGAALKLGDIYYINEPKKARIWYLMATQGSKPEGWYGLCRTYRRLTPEDWDDGLRYCRKAAELGRTQPYADMARAIETGSEDQTADPARALEMYTELAGWGDATATQRLAEIYHARPSSPENDAALLRYTWLAAGFQPKTYLVRLAQYQESGRGVAADTQEAGRFYIHAARYGAPEAIAWLAAHPEVTQAGLDARALPQAAYGDGGIKLGMTRTDRDINDFYPERAYEDEIEGGAAIECRITPSGDLENCIPATESPKGYGFGAAVLRMVNALGFHSLEPEALKPHAGKLLRVSFGWKLS